MRQFRRRKFLIAATGGIAAHALPALAQTERRVRRIGYLSLSDAQSSATWLAAYHFSSILVQALVS